MSFELLFGSLSSAIAKLLIELSCGLDVPFLTCRGGGVAQEGGQRLVYIQPRGKSKFLK